MITVPYIGTPPANLRGNSRGKWQSKVPATKQEKTKGKLTGMDALASGVEPLKDSEVYAHYRVNLHTRIDIDNLAIGFKPFVDGLVESGLIPDDRRITRKVVEVTVDRNRPRFANLSYWNKEEEYGS